MDAHFKKINSLVIKNILLAIVITISIISMDYIFRSSHNMAIHSSFQLSTWYGLFLVACTLTFLKHSANALIIYFLMVFLLFIQFVHFNYYGAQIAPSEITLFFTHTSETMTDFSHLLRIALIPFLLCLASLIVTFIAFYFLPSRVKSRWAWILLILALLIPAKVMIKPIIDHKVGRNPHLSIGDRPNANEDFWNSNQKLWLFYGFYTLPHELFFSSPLPQIVKPPLFIEKHDPHINIIYIQGESLTWQHMSLFGYHRETTPYLDSLKNNSNFIFKRGVSGGVSTDVSLPEFFNMVQQPDGTREIVSLNRNLFKMAQQNGFTTSFISAQNKNWFGLITTYLYPTYINHFAILGTQKAVLDESLLPYIKQADFNKNNFLVLQLIGSHAPYRLRYPEPFEIFKTGKKASFKKGQINTYDNSVIHTDHIIKNIVSTVQETTKEPVYIIFTSDHGESLGYRGKFGHNFLRVRQVHQVPIVIIALNGAPIDFIKSLDLQDRNNHYMSHYELELVIAHLLGYKTPQFSTQQQGYYITGPILNGTAGYEHLTFDPMGKQHIFYHAVE